MNNKGEQPKKDIVWNIPDKTEEFTIRHIPYRRLDAEGEEFISAGVSAKLELIRELMLNNEIPHDVNFDDVADLRFSIS